MKKMTKKKTVRTSSSTKKIYNPVTKTYYKLRVKSTSAGKKGTIIGKYPKSGH